MLQEKIGKDYIQAMKDKDQVKSQTLNFLRAQIKNVQLDKRVDALDDQEVVAVLKKQVKQRKDSIEQFKNGGRDDLVAKEEGELAILKTYLPEELSEDVLKGMVQEAISDTKASSMKDMGGVMKAVLDKAAGQADNKTVSSLVKEALSQL